MMIRPKAKGCSHITDDFPHQTDPTQVTTLISILEGFLSDEPQTSSTTTNAGPAGGGQTVRTIVDVVRFKCI